MDEAMKHGQRHGDMDEEREYERDYGNIDEDMET
jgi:hypothetical protein